MSRTSILILVLAVILVAWFTQMRNGTEKANTPGSGAGTSTTPSGTIVAPATAAPLSIIPATCKMNGSLPDVACTPGTTDAAVTQENIKQTICVSGYTTKVRPPVSYTNPLKSELMKRYGATGAPSDYELDHLISLELGGHPSDPRNLFPQPYLILPGAHEKDQLENKLHALICAGTITLQDAQLAVATDWVSAYHKYVK